MSEGIPSQDGSSFAAPADIADRKELQWPHENTEQMIIGIMCNTLGAGITNRDPNGKPENLIITDGDVTTRLRINVDPRVAYLAQRGDVEAAREEYDPQSGMYFDLLHIDRAGKPADGMFIQEAIDPSVLEVQYHPRDGIYKIRSGADLDEKGRPQTVRETQAYLGRNGYLIPIVEAAVLPGYSKIQAETRSKLTAIFNQMEAIIPDSSQLRLSEKSPQEQARYHELAKEYDLLSDTEKELLKNFTDHPDTQAELERRKEVANQLIGEVMPAFANHLESLRDQTSNARQQIEDIRHRFTQRS